MKPFPDSSDPHHVSEEELVAHLFDDADDPHAVEAALAASADLRRTYEELRLILELVDEDPIPHRADEFGARVWERIEGRLEDETESEPAQVVEFSQPRQASRPTPRGLPIWLGLAAAAVVLLGAGFLLGRLGATVGEPSTAATSGTTSTSDLPALTPQARQRILAVALTEHFGRSERLLAELVNESDRNGETALEQVWAAELLTSNRLYRRAAEAAGQKRIAGLLAELEPVLLELAHAGSGPPNDESSDERNQLRRRVDEQGLLFKVRVTERRLDSPPSPPSPILDSL